MLALQLNSILRHIATKGRPERVTLCLTTNGTRFEPSLFSQAADFGTLVILVSIDGIGESFEYIRYPGKWRDVSNNLEKYLVTPNIDLRVIPTFQIYNALNITDVFRHCDDRNIGLIFNTLSYPLFLAATVLPPKARRVAIDRLRNYAGATHNHDHRNLAETPARELEEKGDFLEPDLIRQFMLFTHDLDQSRKRRFVDIYQEIISLMAEDGFVWTDETLHARKTHNSAA